MLYLKKHYRVENVILIKNLKKIVYMEKNYWVENTIEKILHWKENYWKMQYKTFGENFENEIWKKLYT